MTPQNRLAQYIQTTEFRQWFAGSALADDQGRPLVLYHGARPGMDITEFRLNHETDGIYFTPDPLYAEGFTNELFSDEPTTGAILPVYLSIKNPLIVRAEDGDDDWLSFVDRGLNRQELIAKGYDGAILIEGSTGIIDQVQAYYPHQIKSAIGNAGTFSPETPDIRFSRNDPRYLFAGPQAESSDLQLLDQARKLESIKASPDTIWRETGWIRGVDSKWRYEINDQEATLNIGVSKELEDEVFGRIYQDIQFGEERNLVSAWINEGQPDYLKAFGHTKEDAWRNLLRVVTKKEFKGIPSLESLKGQTVELGDLLNHPRLYAAYPRLREMNVYFDESLPDSQGGSFSYSEGITINPRCSHQKLLEILIHEVQHAIQEAEGFAYGGAPEQRFAKAVKERLKNLHTDQQRKLDEWVKEHKSLLTAEDQSSDMVTYALMYRSMQRLIEYAHKDRPSGMLRLIKSECSWVYHDKVRGSDLARAFDECQRNWYNLPKRHKMAARNRFLQEHCLEMAGLLKSIIPEDIRTQFHSDDRQFRSIVKSLERESQKARQATQPYRELRRDEKTAETLLERHYYSSAYEIYRSLAGEIEARNAEARMTMSDDERRQSPPERTADVKKADAVVIFRDRRGFEAAVPFRASMSAAMPRPALRSSRHNGLTKIEAQGISDGLMRGWVARPDIVAVNRLSELPTALQRDIWDKRAVHDVRAAFYNNTVYVVAPRLPDRNALEEVILHEVIGHYGLRMMLGDTLVPTLESVYAGVALTPLAQEIRQLYFKAPPFDEANADHRQVLAEEVLAKLAESGAHRQLSDQARYEADVRSGLRAMGFRLPMVEGDLLALLQGAEEVVQNGGLSRPSPADAFFQRAFHGSPHQFDHFSTQTMGTGEGAQAFGWGLYFSSQREVAEYYRDALVARENGGAIGDWDTSNLSKVARELLKDLPIGAAIAYAQKREGKCRGLYDGVADELNELRSSRLYHATAEQFDQFQTTTDIGFHLGSRTTAESRQQDLVELYGKKESDTRIIEADVQIKNPIRLQDAGRWDSEAIAYALETAGLITEADIEVYAEKTHEELRAFLQNLGYDGIVYENEMEGGGDSFVAFSADQIQIRNSLGNNANLYEVQIPDNDHLLDYDRPFYAQPSVVQKALAAAYRKAGMPLDNHGFPSYLAKNPEGHALYASLGGIQGARVASERLMAQGISGMRYLDQFSRGSKGEQSHNYVIWDESVISIEAINEQRRALEAKIADSTRFSVDNPPEDWKSAAPFTMDHLLNGEAPSNDPDYSDTLLSKTLFLIRWRVASRLAWFDRDDDREGYRTSLSETWLAHHEDFFDRHMRIADEKNMTLAELEDQYAETLADQLAKDTGGPADVTMLLTGLDKMMGETGRFLDTWADQASEIAFKARKASRCLKQGEWPFVGTTPERPSQLQSFIKDSKIVTANGRPKVLYHATNEDFTAFDPSKSMGVAGSGIYMTTEKPDSDDYGTFVMPLFACIRNPADFTSGDQAINEMAVSLGMPAMSDCSSLLQLREWSQTFRNAMINAGYDGALVAGPDGTEFVVSYHPEQVKSALGNTGAFNGDHSDIRYKRSGGPGLALPDLIDLIPDLMARVEKAYEADDIDEAERLDSELDALFDDLEHRLADIEEDSAVCLWLRRQYDVHLHESWALEPGNETDVEADLEIQLATSYARMLNPNDYFERDNAIANARGALETFRASLENVTDNQILEAMKDCHDRYSGLRSISREKSPTFGIAIQHQEDLEQVLASKARSKSDEDDDVLSASPGAA